MKIQKLMTLLIQYNKNPFQAKWINLIFNIKNHHFKIKKIKLW